MSEVDLAALAESERQKFEAKVPTPLQEIDDAFKSCKFGLFHVKLILTSAVGYMAGIFVTNTIPYILPNAECDLNMNLLQKGVLNASAFVGMCFSSMLAGFLTDTFGRKIFIVSGYGGIFFFSILAGFSQTYEMLMTAKFFEGFLFAVAFSPTVTYSSEFCHSGIRDRVMLLNSSAQASGQIVLAAISWAVLTNEWHLTFFNGYIVLNTWNCYFFIISLFSLTACTLYSFMPESPKYLLTQHKYEEARRILIRIYMQNTRKPADTYPHKDIWKRQVNQSIKESSESKTNDGFVRMLVTGLHNCKSMFRRPLVLHLALLCTMMLLTMVLFNIVRLWFPQLSTIVEHYSKNPETNKDLCTMLDAYTSTANERTLNTTREACVPTVAGTETYINSIIMSSFGLVNYFLSGVLVNKLGKKILIISAGLITIGCTLGLRWAVTKVHTVALFATSMAMCQTIQSLLQTTAVEIFPTNVRTTAISMIMMSGRVATLIGNIMFPILLAMGCAVPFFTLAGVMICVTVMTFWLPQKK